MSGRDTETETMTLQIALRLLLSWKTWALTFLYGASNVPKLAFSYFVRPLLAAELTWSSCRRSSEAAWATRSVRPRSALPTRI